jgi:hypothetical protein
MDPLKLAAILLFALFPFVGALLLTWIGPKRTAAAGYKRAMARRAATSDAADEERHRLEAADARLTESQRRLTGEDG